MTTQSPLLHRRRERGFTLLEVLIALVILAIGLLGLAALQARGMKFNTDAYVRSQGTMIAYDVMERMRTAGNAAAAKFVSTGAPSGYDCSTVAKRQVAGVTTAAVSQELACWYQDLADKLPAGSGSIAQVSGTTDEYTITVNWYDRETTATKSQSWVVKVF